MSTFFGFKELLFAPALLKSLSEGTKVARRQRYFRAGLLSVGYTSIWVFSLHHSRESSWRLRLGVFRNCCISVKAVVVGCRLDDASDTELSELGLDVV